MRFDLVRPCPHCPFRTDGEGYLREDRARDIALALARGADFACHQTTVDDPDDEFERIATSKSQMCAGAMIAMLREDAPNQTMRIAERLGLFDPGKLDTNAPVGTLDDFIRRHSDDTEDDIEPCNASDYGCLAPAGYLEGGSVITAIEREQTVECDLCGQPVCEECSVDGPDGGRACRWHEEDEADA